MSKQITLWRSTDTPVTNATEYCCPMGNGSWFGPEASQAMVVATAGTFRNLRVVTSAAPGVGKSWTVTLRVNGSSSALTVTISGTDTDEEDITHDVSVSAGDVIALQFTPSGTPSAMTPSVSLEFDSTTAGASMYGSGSGNIVAISRATALFGGDTSGNWSNEACVNAVEGDFTALYVSLDGAPGTGSYTFAIQKNGTLQDGSGGTVDTRVTIANAATSGNASFTLPCSPGDLFRLSVVPASPGTSRRPRYGVCLIADTPGVSNFSSSPTDNTNGGATEYFAPCGDASGLFTGTEADHQATAGVAFELHSLQFALSSVPGGATAYTATLRVNGSDTALAATISGASASASDSDTVSIVPGDLLSLKMAPTGVPGAKKATWAFSQQVITARPRSYGYIF